MAEIRRQADTPLPSRADARGLTGADRRLLGVLGDDYRNASELARRMGVKRASVGKMVSDARKRGALIETRSTGGYRLRQERSA